MSAGVAITILLPCAGLVIVGGAAADCEQAIHFDLPLEPNTLGKRARAMDWTATVERDGVGHLTVTVLCQACTVKQQAAGRVAPPAARKEPPP